MALSEIKAPRPAAVRRISILGATGSIGTSTADLIRRNRDRFDVVAVTAHRNADACEQIFAGLRTVRRSALGR